MRLRDILVSLDPTRVGLGRLEAALRLARRHGAEVIGYYGAPTVGLFGFVGGGLAAEPVSGEAVPAGEIAEEMRVRFEEALRRHDVAGVWLLGSEPIVDDLVARVRTVDLAVVGLDEPEDDLLGPQGFRPADLILGAGRPILGLPSANVPEQIGAEVIVAWDGSREASRALHDALPLLVHADTVTVVSVDEPAEGSVAAVTAHLRRHGIDAVHGTEPTMGGMSVAEVLLARTDQLRADLLVAGAYGRSRLGEAVFGGVSRTLLRQMMIPVLMSH